MAELKSRPGDSKAKGKRKGSYKDVYSNNIDGGGGMGGEAIVNPIFPIFGSVYINK